MTRKNYIKSLLPVYIIVLISLVVASILTSKAVHTVAENTPIPDRKCIIIDAGHGGVDGGATSVSGMLESQINLEIAIRLNDLMHLIGMDTRMIRTTDCSVYTEGESIAAKKVSDLKNRVRITNETDNALLISIHQNYFTDGKYDGAQVFYNKNDESKLLANQLQAAFVKTLNPDSKRQAKKSNGIYLMEHIDCCGILVECGFISNHEEDIKLQDPTYQKTLCSVICCTVSQFLYGRNTIT